MLVQRGFPGHSAGPFFGQSIKFGGIHRWIGRNFRRASAFAFCRSRVTVVCQTVILQEIKLRSDTGYRPAANWSLAPNPVIPELEEADVEFSTKNRQADIQVRKTGGQIVLLLWA